MNHKVLYMKNEQKYIKDLNEIRSMMERSTKFLSLTGWSGIMAGLYALAGIYIAYGLISSQTEGYSYNMFSGPDLPAVVLELFLLGAVILVLAVGTAVFLSYRNARKSGDKLWNGAARRLAVNMAIPLVSGGILILILTSNGLFGLSAPLSLVFYGLALFNASKFTYEEFRYLGIIEIALGLAATYFIGYSLWFWAIGFGVMHIIYGIYMQLRYGK